VAEDEASDDEDVSLFLKSVVHKEYKQEKCVDEDGLSSWTSKCKHCEETFPHKDAIQLKDHLKYHHTEIYQIVVQNDKKALKRHEKSQEVPVNGMEVSADKSRIHSSAVHNEFIYTNITDDGKSRRASNCKHCGKTLRDNNCSTRKRHLEGFHPEVYRKVQMADIDSLDQNLMRAFDKHDTEFVCEICSKEFKMKVTYDQHMGVHEDERRKKNTEMCPHCGEEFRYVDKHIQRTQCNLPEHERTAKENISKDFICEHCLKAFERKAYLNYHIKCVHSERNIFCDQCDYKTYSNNNLRMHIVRVHEKKELYVHCPMCNKKVTSLDWHIKTYHKEGV